MRFLILFLVLLGSAASAAAGEVYVVFWFDTEDYITPASDDAALRIARILTEHGIRGTFKITGEKARVLESRGRRDVIEALRKHDIGYHTNLHSVPPHPAAYLDRLGWDEGVEEFYRREQEGARAVARVFRRPLSCYGQPGNSWGPQAYAALKRMGVGMYLDSGRHVGLNDDMFWYAGMLNFFDLGRKETRLRLGGNSEENLAKATAEFDSVFRGVKAAPGPGSVISIIYHPWEFIAAKAWDAVNFLNGANPPRELWQPSPLRPAADTERDYATFARYVAHIRGTAGVKFATGTDLMRLYPDTARERTFSREQVLDLARQTREEVSYQVAAGSDVALSAAEVLSLLAQALATGSRAGAAGRPGPLRAENWMGPRHRGRTTRTEPAARWEIVAAAADLLAATRGTGYLPGEVWLGSATVTPEDFASLAAAALLEPSAQSLPITSAKFAPAAHVRPDAENLWDWIIHPKGMRAPNLMELARLQSWTLKPAVLRPR